MDWQDELKEIAEQNDGILMPEDVVQFARNVKTALHSHFTWDNSEAAERYRLIQARQLIRVVVTYVDKKQASPVRAWVSLSTDRKEDGGYRPVATVVKQKTLRNTLLQDALNELAAFRNKYRTLSELSEVFSAIDDVMKHENGQIEKAA